MKITTTVKYEKLVFTLEEREFLLKLNQVVNDIAATTEQWYGDVMQQVIESIEVSQLSEEGCVISLDDII